MNIVRRSVVTGVALVVMASLAVAHGPTRKKHTETVEINVPSAKVWERIGNFQDMSWHPAVAKTEGTNGNDIGAKRVLTLQGDGTATIAEELYKYSTEKMSYSYRINKVEVTVLPVTNYSSHLTVKPMGDEKTLVEWRGAFYRGYPNNDPPPELNEAAAIKAVSGVYRSGLDALKKELENGGS
ncbi:MAG: SRPBCC family protein [Pseudomonadota bacterium]